MSIEEADALMENFDKWTAKKERDAFRQRMEHKLNRKERYTQRH
jgi:hypothetical protein